LQICKNTALLEDTEIKVCGSIQIYGFFVDAMQALRDQFYADLNQEETNTGAPARDKDEGTIQGEVVPPTVRQEHKFKLRKKAKDDFFALDEDL